MEREAVRPRQGVAFGRREWVRPFHLDASQQRASVDPCETTRADDLARDKLAAARGIALAVALSLPIWIALGTAGYILVASLLHLG